jgi:hypothetical protein
MPKMIYEELAGASTAEEVEGVLNKHGASLEMSEEEYKEAYPADGEKKEEMDGEMGGEKSEMGDDYDYDESMDHESRGGEGRGAIVIAVKKKMDDYDKKGKRKGFGYGG